MVLAQKQTKDHWNRIEDPDTSPHSYSYLIFDKKVQTMHWRKVASLTNGAGKTEYSSVED
jgi:hypothetical protein